MVPNNIEVSAGNVCETTAGDSDITVDLPASKREREAFVRHVRSGTSFGRLSQLEDTSEFICGFLMTSL